MNMVLTLILTTAKTLYVPKQDMYDDEDCDNDSILEHEWWMT